MSGTGRGVELCSSAAARYPDFLLRRAEATAISKYGDLCAHMSHLMPDQRDPLSHGNEARSQELGLIAGVRMAAKGGTRQLERALIDCPAES